MYTYKVTFISESRRDYRVFIEAETRKEAIKIAKDMWHRERFGKMYIITASRVKNCSSVKYNEFEIVRY